MKDQNNPSSPVGLDVGTSRIVTARGDASAPAFASELNAFVEIPWSGLTQRSLEREGVPFTTSGGTIVVQGTESARFARLTGGDVRRSMSRGLLNPGEPESVPQLRNILRGLLAGVGSGTHVWFSVPAAPDGCAESATWHESAVAEIIRELGCVPHGINEALAVAYSELESSNYTGVAVSLGGGLCNVCLSWMASPAITFSVARGGDFIDTSAASATGDAVTAIRSWKEESFYFNGAWSDKASQALGVYYDEVVAGVLAAMRENFAASSGVPRVARPVPMVLSGGSALPKGFRDRFQRALEASPFPIPISEVRLASDPLHATARGALIAGLSKL